MFIIYIFYTVQLFYFLNNSDIFYMDSRFAFQIIYEVMVEKTFLFCQINMGICLT